MKHLVILLLFLVSCEKEPICNDLIKQTWSNRAGYWDYCTYQSNEINTDLILTRTEIVNSCDNKRIDTVYFSPFNCQRSGTFAFMTRIKIE